MVEQLLAHTLQTMANNEQMDIIELSDESEKEEIMLTGKQWRSHF